MNCAQMSAIPGHNNVFYWVCVMIAKQPDWICPDRRVSYWILREARQSCDNQNRTWAGDGGEGGVAEAGPWQWLARLRGEATQHCSSGGQQQPRQHTLQYHHPASIHCHYLHWRYCLRYSNRGFKAAFKLSSCNIWISVICQSSQKLIKEEVIGIWKIWSF